MEPRTLQVRIMAGTVDIGAKIAGRELEGRIVDNGGEKADELHFSISNYDGQLAKPAKGAELTVSLGYVETGGPILMGKFIVETVEKIGPVATFMVTAHAADFKKALKARQTRSFANVTFGDIINKIAGEAGLAALCDPELAAKPIDHIAQTEESAMHFLTRLGRHFDAICKPANGKLIAVPRGAGTNGTGAAIAPFIVTPNDLTTFRFCDRDRPAHGKVTAHYYDHDQAKRVPVSAGDGDAPAFLHHDLHPSKDDAQRAADNHSNGFARKGKSFTGTMFGRPELKAGGVLITQGFSDDDDAEWIFLKAEHVFGSGLTTQIEGQPKKAGAASGTGAKGSAGAGAATTNLSAGTITLGSNVA